METPKAARGQRDPEFLARMREKAAAKKAQLKVIRDAEELQKKQAHEAKLAQARKVLGGSGSGAAVAQHAAEEPEPAADAATAPPPPAEPERPKPRKAKKPPPEPETEESESEEETEEEAEEPPPPPRKTKAKPRASAQPAQPAFSWKEAYYHAKLERMMQPPHPQPQPQPPSIHQAVRHDIVQRVNKRMMDDLMKEYFPHG